MRMQSESQVYDAARSDGGGSGDAQKHGSWECSHELCLSWDTSTPNPDDRVYLCVDCLQSLTGAEIDRAREENRERGN
jgi:hypothetical protein